MPSRRDPSPRLLTFARTMRRQPTDAERKLWDYLRDRKLAGFKFRRQVPVAGYIVDFLCESASTAVELDSEQHGDPDAVEYDRKRSEKLAELRIRVFRFSDRFLNTALTLTLSHTRQRHSAKQAIGRVREREPERRLKAHTPLLPHPRAAHNRHSRNSARRT